MPDTAVGIILVERHRSVAEAYAEGLAREPDLVIVDIIQMPTALFALRRSTPASVVTVDVDDPGVSGVDLTRRILRRWPRIGVILIGGESCPSDTLAAVAAGARGWVARSAPLCHLTAAIRIVAGGGVFLPANLFRAALRGPPTPPGVPLPADGGETAPPNRGGTLVSVADALPLRTVLTSRPRSDPDGPCHRSN